MSLGAARTLNGVVKSEKSAPITSLRTALQIALAVARLGEAENPPVPAPSRLRPYLGFAKAPTAALELCRRVVDDDETFRRRVAAAVTVDQVGALGWLWLTRPEHWEATSAELFAELERERLHTTVARRQDELERRQAAAVDAAQLAEQARREAAAGLEAARTELAEARRQIRELLVRMEQAETAAARQHDERIGLLRQLKAAEALVARRSSENRGLREQLDQARRPAEARPGEDPGPSRDLLRASIDAAARAAQSMTRAASEVTKAMAQAGAALTQLQQGGASTHEQEADQGHGPATSAATEPAAAQPSGAQPSGAAAPAFVPIERRRALRMPPGTFEDAHPAAVYLSRVSQVLFLVDGYNVSKLGWPDLELRLQRERLVEALVTLQARTGAQTDVVFDGVDDAEVHARVAPGRLRVEFTVAAVEADDRLLELVELTPARRPVVVVSSDRRVRDGARQRGANTISAEQLLGLLR